MIILQQLQQPTKNVPSVQLDIGVLLATFPVLATVTVSAILHLVLVLVTLIQKEDSGALHPFALNVLMDI